MHPLKLMFAGLSIVLMAGCASGLNPAEERRYMAFEREGVLVKEKNPTAGAWLGLLPGVGSFYAGEPILGLVNLVVWPASIFWDPISGYRGSKSLNYNATIDEIERKKDKKLASLTEQLALGNINKRSYIVEKKKIETKYGFK